jgi:hypothetical protein
VRDIDLRITSKTIDGSEDNTYLLLPRNTSERLQTLIVIRRRYALTRVR